MKSFEVIALGVGDTFSEHHHTSALLLACDGFQACRRLSRHGYRAVLRTAGEAVQGGACRWRTSSTFFITHVHGDHMNGLEGVAFYKQFAEGKRPAGSHATAEVRAVIWEQRLARDQWSSSGRRGVRMRTLGFDELLRVLPRLRWTNRVRDRSISASSCAKPCTMCPRRPCSCALAGRKFGYSSDTAFDPELIEFLSVADVIVHETNLGPAHSAYSDLLTVPAAIREKMKLIHYPDGFDTATSEIACLAEGDVLRRLKGKVVWKRCPRSRLRCSGRRYF